MSSVWDRAWLLWVGGSLVLGVLEVSTLDLIFIMLAGGALAGALADVSGLGAIGQVLVASVTSGLLLLLVRPVLLRRLRVPSANSTNTPALVGRTAVVLERVSVRGGRIRLAGEVWSARSADPAHSFPGGTDVVVVRIDGATAIVTAAATVAEPDPSSPPPATPR